MRQGVFAFLILAQAICAPAQNLLTNGSFESPGLPNSQPMLLLTNGSTFITGWTAIDDNIGQPPFYTQRPRTDAVLNGNFGVILNQGSGLATSFLAEPGALYQLTVWVRPNDCIQCVTPAPLRVTISGTSYTLPLVSGWSQQTVQFFAPKLHNTLELLNPSSSSDYKQFGLDDVQILKLPGPVLKARFYPGIVIEGFPGQKYQIQAAPSLGAGATWETLTNIVIPVSPYLYMDVDPKRPYDYPPARRIYRAVQVP